jgi:hypothetical protein
MMAQNPLGSLGDYSRFVAALVDRPTVLRSTLVVWSVSPYTGIAEGEVLFPEGFRLRVLEELDFDARLITGYSYEVYQHGEKIYWYDDYPHPHDPILAATHPHHKHIPPDIKHHRVPAPSIHCDRPNLPTLIAEVEGLLANENQGASAR